MLNHLFLSYLKIYTVLLIKDARLSRIAGTECMQKVGCGEKIELIAIIL